MTPTGMDQPRRLLSVHGKQAMELTVAVEVEEAEVLELKRRA